jgi:signal transduction histidine kinase
VCVHEGEECGGAARFGTRPFARGSGDGHQRVRRGKCPFSYHGARAEKSEFNIKLQRDFDTSVGAVDLQPHEITRAILNLISYGFYAASKRKSDAVDDAFEPVLRAMTRNLGEAVEIRISDNGTGMPPELKENVQPLLYDQTGQRNCSGPAGARRLMTSLSCVDAAWGSRCF